MTKEGIWFAICLALLVGCVLLALDSPTREQAPPAGTSKRAVTTPNPQLIGSPPAASSVELGAPSTVAANTDEVQLTLLQEASRDPVPYAEISIVDYRDAASLYTTSTDAQGIALLPSAYAGRLCAIELHSRELHAVGAELLVLAQMNTVFVRPGCLVQLRVEEPPSTYLGKVCQYTVRGQIRSTVLTEEVTPLQVVSGGVVRILGVGDRGVAMEDAAQAIPKVGEHTIVVRFADMEHVPGFKVMLPSGYGGEYDVSARLYAEGRSIGTVLEKVEGGVAWFRAMAGQYTAVLTTSMQSAVVEIEVRRMGLDTEPIATEWQRMGNITAYVERVATATDLYLRPSGQDSPTATTVRRSRTAPSLELWGADAPDVSLRWDGPARNVGGLVEWVVPTGCEVAAYVSGSDWAKRSPWTSTAPRSRVLSLEEIPTLTVVPDVNRIQGAWTVSARRLGDDGQRAHRVFLGTSSVSPIVLHNFSGHSPLRVVVASSSFRGELDWSGDRNNTVRLASVPLATRTMSVVTASGRPVAGVPVVVRHPEAGAIDGITDAQGRLTLHIWDLPGVVASVVGNRYRSNDFPISLLDDESTIQAFPLHRVSILYGGASARRLRLSATPDTGIYEREPFTAHPDTQFELSCLPPGLVRLKVEESQNGAWTTLVERELLLPQDAPAEETIEIGD